MTEMKTQPLAVYKSIADYVPAYSDFVIRAGWFRTWYGVVVDFDADNQTVAISFEGTPCLLFTMQSDEINDSLHVINLSDIKKMKKGRWYVQKSSGGQNVWYL